MKAMVLAPDSAPGSARSPTRAQNRSSRSAGRPLLRYKLFALLHNAGRARSRGEHTHCRRDGEGRARGGAARCRCWRHDFSPVRLVTSWGPGWRPSARPSSSGGHVFLLLNGDSSSTWIWKRPSSPSNGWRGDATMVLAPYRGSLVLRGRGGGASLQRAPASPGGAGAGGAGPLTKMHFNRSERHWKARCVAFPTPGGGGERHQPGPPYVRLIHEGAKVLGWLQQTAIGATSVPPRSP